MFEQEVYKFVEQRVVLKLLSWEGVKLAESLRRLNAQFADKTLSRIQVYDRKKDFRWAVQNETHARRSGASTSEMNILAIREMIKGDRRLTTWDIVRISYGSALSIISGD